MIIDNGLYVAEKTNKLSNIDIFSGDTKWSIKIPNTWGWLCSFRNNLYYLAQSGNLLIIDKATGLVINSGRIDSFYPGYVIPSEKVLISGGWRGYSDLSGYDSVSFKKLWSINTKNKDLQEISVPHLLNEELFLIVNHSIGKIEIIYIHSGKVKHEIDLPSELSCPDLDHSFQIIDNKIVFVSQSGEIHTLNDEFSSLHTESLDINYILTTLPYISNSNLVYEDAENNYCLYSISKHKVLWRQKMENNHNTRVRVCELAPEIYLLGGSLGQLKVIGRDGGRVGYIKSEKRISTPLTKISDLVVYGNKSEIKVIQMYE